MLFTDEQVAVVTGASKGIGAACAIDLAAEGATVVVNYNRDRAGAEAVVEIIQAAGGRGIAVAADIADESAVQAMFAEVRKRFGRLDVLIANAGITRDAVFMRMSTTDWESVINVNVTGTFLTCREAFRLMTLHRSGAIVTIASVTSQGFPSVANYAASKGAIISFTKAIATEGALLGIRANVVSPALADTPLVRDMPDRVRRHIVDNTALGRTADVAEIASVCTFLASSRASFCTGAEYLVDGGASLGLVLQRSELEHERTRRRISGLNGVNGRLRTTPHPPAPAAGPEGHV